MISREKKRTGAKRREREREALRGEKSKINFFRLWSPAQPFSTLPDTWFFLLSRAVHFTIPSLSFSTFTFSTRALGHRHLSPKVTLLSWALMPTSVSLSLSLSSLSLSLSQCLPFFHSDNQSFFRSLNASALILLSLPLLIQLLYFSFCSFRRRKSANFLSLIFFFLFFPLNCQANLALRKSPAARVKAEATPKSSLA